MYQKEDFKIDNGILSIKGTPYPINKMVFVQAAKVSSKDHLKRMGLSMLLGYSGGAGGFLMALRDLYNGVRYELDVTFINGVRNELGVILTGTGENSDTIARVADSSEPEDFKLFKSIEEALAVEIHKWKGKNAFGQVF